MSTIEEIFLSTRAIFAVQAAEAMEEAMDKIYDEYLPHVENDTASNVRFQTGRWLDRFFAGTLREDDIKVDLLSQYSGKAARQKIYEANREEIVQALGRDFEAEIEGLKEQINAVYRGY